MKPRLSTLKPRLQTLDPADRLRPLRDCRPRKGPFANSATADQRLRGRALQARNEKIKTRDGWRCKSCGRITDQLEVDHIVPLAHGGTEDDSNLQALCAGRGGCHERKSRRDARGG